MRDVLALIIGIIFPVLAGYIVRWLMNVLKGASSLVDGLPSAVKQVLVVAISAALAFIYGYLGVASTNTTLAAVSATDIQAVLTAALAMIFYNSDKLKGTTTTTA